MHIDLDEDNAERYSKASQGSNVSARRIINAILRTVKEVNIQEIIEVNLKKEPGEEQKPGRPKVIRKESSWRVRVF